MLAYLGLHLMHAAWQGRALAGSEEAGSLQAQLAKRGADLDAMRRALAVRGCLLAYESQGATASAGLKLGRAGP